MAEVTHLYRYPIKGLSAQACEYLALTRADGLALDRAYAVALGSTAFDPAHPEPLPKTAFLMLQKNERLAALRATFDDESGRLAIESDGAESFEANVDEAAGARALEDYLSAFVGAEAARGRLRLVRAPHHRFTDVSVVSPAMMRAVSLVNLASVRELSRAMNRPLHHLRFRANVYFDGVPPWAELAWPERVFRLGNATLRALKATRRCAATHVDPQTAQRDADVVGALVEHFGHANMGVYAEVRSDGTVATGDVFDASGNL